MVDAPEPPPAAADARPPTNGRHYRVAQRRLRRWPRRLLISVNILTVVVIAAAAVGAVYVVGIFGDIHRLSVTGLAPITRKGDNDHIAAGTKAKPFTMLIVGSDTRNLSTPTGLNIGSEEANDEGLADSIVLARIVPSRHMVALLSVPRDLVVNIPGLGMQKINAAFAGNNASRLVRTIETDLDIPVNHFAAVNFDTLEEVADTVGGVEQFFPTPAFDMESDLFVPTAGCVNLVGPQALAFVRSRNYFFVPSVTSLDPGSENVLTYEQSLVDDGEADLQLAPESDLGRIQRQQAFIRNVLHKAQRTGALGNPSKLLSIVTSLAKNLTLDNSFSDQDIINLAGDFRHIDAAGIPSWTYPTVNNPVYGLSQVPSADAAMVAQFEAFGTTPATSPSTTSTTTTPTRGSATSTTSSTLPPSSISVEVENGSGVSGQAGTASSDLQAAGYTVSGTSDATSYGNSSNVVEYGPDGADAAATLQGALSGGATLRADASLSGTDLVLITGTSFAGLAASGSSGSSSTTGATTTTVPATTTTTAPADGNAYQSATAIVATSSSYYHLIYIPPGRLPGQQVSTCGN